jgi:hypothetical protein
MNPSLHRIYPLQNHPTFTIDLAHYYTHTVVPNPNNITISLYPRSIRKIALASAPARTSAVNPDSVSEQTRADISALHTLVEAGDRVMLNERLLEIKSKTTCRVAWLWRLQNWYADLDAEGLRRAR